MITQIKPLKPLALATIFMCAASSAFAQDAGQGQKPAAKKVVAEKKTASLKPGQYATEAAAEAACKGATVVWTDSDNFNHYKGSREYGKKPGAFVCEK